MILSVLDDPPDQLAELRGVLLHEHEWREREGIGYGTTFPAAVGGWKPWPLSEEARSQQRRSMCFSHLTAGGLGS